MAFMLVLVFSLYSSGTVMESQVSIRSSSQARKRFQGNPARE